MGTKEQIEKMAADIRLNMQIQPNPKEHPSHQLARLLVKDGYCKASELIAEIDNALHDMATEYANSRHPDYFAVCEMVHHKVIRPIERKYTGE